MKEGRQPSLDQESEPGDRDGGHDEPGPNGEHHVLRNRKQDPEEHGEKTLPILDHAIRDIDKLEPPASEKALSDQWLTQVRGLKDDLQEIRDKAKAGDIQGVQAIVPKATEHNSKSNALATQLGMSVCNKD